MQVSAELLDLANELRVMVQNKTETVSQGEGVAMFLLWTFFMDHATIEGVDVSDLARHQVNAFIEYAADNVTMARTAHH